MEGDAVEGRRPGGPLRPRAAALVREAQLLAQGRTERVEGLRPGGPARQRRRERREEEQGDLDGVVQGALELERRCGRLGDSLREPGCAGLSAARQEDAPVQPAPLAARLGIGAEAEGLHESAQVGVVPGERCGRAPGTRPGGSPAAGSHGASSVLDATPQMPRRQDIKSILLLGSGPIVIGQACEFDYSGVQALKALREEGYRTILLNSNPATIMTDPEWADRTYIEPITVEAEERILAAERPDAVLPTLGGQTALNLAVRLAREGILAKYGAQLIGAQLDAIEKAEDRQRFKDTMTSIGIDVPKSGVAHDMEGVAEVGQRLGFPLILRPSFTLGGLGGGIAYNHEELDAMGKRALEYSPTNEVLIEESVLGWKEYELEVMRDHQDNVVIICSIENVDPMGVHTGDSITVAPAMTLSDVEYQNMRDMARRVIRAIGVETGGSNIQCGVAPRTGRIVVIEMNPRVSRSSALASKATGFPIAKIAAKLAVGYTLDELKNDITGGATPAAFEPSIDYVVTKVPRFTFEKFPAANDRLTTQMKSVGEVMAIGRTFQESLQKALRGLETGLDGFNLKTVDPETIADELAYPRAERLWYVADALAIGMPLEEVYRHTKIDRWFLAQIKEIVDTELEVEKSKLEDISGERLRSLKRMGFSDRRLAHLTKATETGVRPRFHPLGIRPVYKRVHTCAAEFSTRTAYMSSTYEDECEAQPTDRKKVIVLGGGPNRIGQGTEFDNCCVHAALALREDGYETIMVNCNPETVSTDYD